MNTPPLTRHWLLRLARRAAAPVALIGIVAVGSLTGAHAAGLITGSQIKDGSVSARDVRNGSLRGAQVALGTLRPADFSEDATGPTGPDGPLGPTGTVRGPAGFRGVSYVVGDPVVVTGFETVIASCPAGTKVIGGGTAVGNNSSAVSAGTATSAPTDDGAAWISTVYQWSPGDTTEVFPWALCAEVD